MSMIGFESPATEYAQDKLSLDDFLIPHPSATYLARAQGHAMDGEGSGIVDGDVLIVDRAETAQTGSVIVAELNGQFICRYLDKENRRLLSARDDYPPIELTEGDVFRIEGVVITTLRLHQVPPQLRE